MAIEESGNGQASSRNGREKAFLFICFLIVGALCFEAGLLSKAWGSEEPVVVTIIENSAASLSLPEEPVLHQGEPSFPAPEKIGKTEGPAVSDCPYVGSKNSDKYHIPTCSYAKRILPANRVCFSSEEEAQKKGYTPGCLK